MDSEQMGDLKIGELAERDRKIVALYQAGTSAVDLSFRFGLSRGRIHRIVAESQNGEHGSVGEAARPRAQRRDYPST